MNGRFSRLEFGAAQAGETFSESARAHETGEGLRRRENEGEVIRSAAHYLAGAEASARRGRFEEALQLYTRTLREDRARVAAWVGQVHMLVEMGENAEARLWADKSLELFRNNGELLAGKSRACIRQGDRASARGCSDASLQAPGSSAARWIARGEVLLADGEARARDCFDKAMSEPGADWYERIIVARIYLLGRKPAVAFEFAKLGTERAPAEVFAWLVQARCLHELGNDSRAKECCARALELDARCLEARAMREEFSRPVSGLARRLKGWLSA